MPHRLPAGLSAALRNTPLAALVWTAEGDAVRTLDWNAAAERIFGWSRDEMVGRDFRDLIPAEEARPAVRDLVDSVVIDQLPRNMQNWCCTRDGGLVLVEWFTTPIPGEDGSLVILSQGHDVTEAHRQREALAESEARFRSLIGSLQDIVFTVGPDLRHTAIFGDWADRIGLGAQHFLGRTPSEVMGPEQGALHEAQMRRALAGEYVVYGWATEGPEGERHYQTSLSPWRDTKGRVVGAIGIGQDRTDLREAQVMRRRLEDRLLQAQKLESVGRLAGGVAHDFNNLLTVLRGNLDLSLDRLPPGHGAREGLEEALQTTGRASNLVRQLLAFSRRQILEPEVLDAGRVLREMEVMLRRLLREDVALDVQVATDLWRVLVDPAQLEQVVVNLAINARDAMPDGGRLTLSLKNVTLDGVEAAELADAAPGDYVRLGVADTGTGMDEEVLAHLFEPFFTTKGDEGTGLGLATVYGIVRQTGGYVSVESTPGRGSTFRVHLPRTDRPLASEPEPAAPKVRPAAASVLVVEDEAAVRRVVVQALELGGHRVLQAEHAEAALALASDPDLRIDVLVSDVVMPGLRGPELERRLRPRFPEMRTLFISGYSEEEISHGGILKDGVDFLPKPFSVRELLDRVATLLRGG